jgi:hypothetical protein
VNNPVWVIQSLVSNAIKEGEGSQSLAMIADECERRSLSSDIAIHVTDEARHCRMYVGLIETVFPGALGTALRKRVASHFPPLRYVQRQRPVRPLWATLDYLIQVNLGELRTRIHQGLMEPVLHAYCPDENESKLCKTMDTLRCDECKHFQYTAARIGALAEEFTPTQVEELFIRRYQDFNRYTERELGTQADGLGAAPLIRDPAVEPDG